MIKLLLILSIMVLTIFQFNSATTPNTSPTNMTFKPSKTCCKMEKYSKHGFRNIKSDLVENNRNGIYNVTLKFSTPKSSYFKMDSFIFRVQILEDGKNLSQVIQDGSVQYKNGKENYQFTMTNLNQSLEYFIDILMHFQNVLIYQSSSKHTLKCNIIIHSFV
ncbi:uncharacterized protein LOC135930939 [Gordionus sp. m RMFG-2023]|uniref:uncharacterized protein LOC135930939 n=1 Tax=Gordionus sp. m RMFG-2023 TaxID=3053472 RepID=UPI0031FC9F39